MTLTDVLLVATPGLPLALAAACVLPGVRARMSSLLALAPVPGLLAALLAAHAPPATFGTGLYRPTLALDAPGALLLGVAALLWIAAGAYAATYQRGAANPGRFAVCWLLGAAGCLGVFVAADMPARPAGPAPRKACSSTVSDWSSRCWASRTMSQPCCPASRASAS